MKSLCKICGREYVYNRKKGHTRTKCNTCMVNLRRFKVKLRCVEYKGGKCERCGYDKCNEALEFHHLDQAEKDFGISGSHCRKWSDIEKELDKCIMLCSNCHRELEHGCWNINGPVAQPG